MRAVDLGAETGKPALEAADEVLNEPDPGFHLTGLDLPRLIAEGVGGERWLHEPYLPERADVWAFGAAGSARALTEEYDKAQDSPWAAFRFLDRHDAWAEDEPPLPADPVVIRLELTDKSPPVLGSGFEGEE
jgi:hypothetical protein